jgi:curli production assembly/transport component CsgF
MKKTYIILTLCAVSALVYSQDFIYQAQNPAFGGSPYNYSWLMSSAQAQDTYSAPDDDAYSSFDRYESDPVDDFAESLNRQILSQLSRELVSAQFGEDGLEEGSYTLGDYQIEIGNSNSGMTISIIDLTTGATTNVAVPYF